MLINTPEPPYYAVIFSSKLIKDDVDYFEMASRMEELAKNQTGFLGLEHARDEIGITISYWTNKEAIINWKNDLEHQVAQKIGKEKWYEQYSIRIAKVERSYNWKKME